MNRTIKLLLVCLLVLLLAAPAQAHSGRYLYGEIKCPDGWHAQLQSKAIGRITMALVNDPKWYGKDYINYVYKYRKFDGREMPGQTLLWEMVPTNDHDPAVWFEWGRAVCMFNV